MGQLTIRKVDDELIRRLKLRAAANKRSAEAEMRVILEEALKEGPKAADFWDRAAAFRARFAGRDMGDSTEIIREARDELSRKFE